MSAGALERYREREGKYPPSLELLSPKDIEAVPATGLRVFSDEPFNYRVLGSEYELRYYGALMMSCARTTRPSWECAD